MVSHLTIFYPDPWFETDLQSVAAELHWHYHKYIVGMVLTQYTIVVKTTEELDPHWVAHNVCQTPDEFYTLHIDRTV